MGFAYYSVDSKDAAFKDLRSRLVQETFFTGPSLLNKTLSWYSSLIFSGFHVDKRKIGKVRREKHSFIWNVGMIIIFQHARDKDLDFSSVRGNQ